ncbi:aminoglycoside phosphotransferase family protein [Streptomyces sp. NBC_01537]|uniref:phosphotransferase family protein n=1 Tax=Streptomyces sp. NBC_01537 TaxID=2903896 RepID=UPI0038697CCA
MQSQTKRLLTAGELDAMLRRSSGTGCRMESELTDGWFNSAYRVRLDDGRPAVVKVAPPDGVPVLRYELGIMATEAMVYRQLAAVAGVPQPELIHQGPDFLVISVLDGLPWDKAGGDKADGQEALRRELGRITARLHTVRSPDGRFGYPAPEAGLGGPDWPTAFTAMTDALLADADRWEIQLDVTPAEVRSLVAAGTGALAEVTEPALVHFDLWPGNIFIADGSVTGLIDHERAFYGDPAAELVSLDFGGDTGPGSPLVAGYLEAGGRLDFTPSLHHRLALYRLYLGLLLVVECGPRGYTDADHIAFSRGMLGDAVRALRKLG